MTERPDLLVDAEHLQVYLGAAHILRGVTLQVRRGEVVAIMGTNGSGKSTLIRTLLGITTPTSGTVRLPHPDRVGYVPQRVSASGGLPATAQEVVASGLLGPGRLRMPRDWKARAHTALGQVGLDDRCHDPTNHLSGGQQQRVLIARALVRHPELLVLDEPVAGVDHDSQEQFAATLAGLIETGITIIVVLHELGELAPLITRAVVLRHGLVVHDGAPPAARSGHDGIGHIHVHPHTVHSVDTAPDETGFQGLDGVVTTLTTHRGTVL